MPLIVFEGPEGAGKTTQVGKLADWLTQRRRAVVCAREPGGTPFGDEIRRLLLDPTSDISPRAEALLFMASRAQLVEREIVPALTSGAIVLLDRYFLSTYAYQVVGRGMPEEEIRVANRLATGGLRPDCTLLLDLPAGEGLRRAEHRGPRDRMEQADVAFHERVQRAFALFATAEWQAAHPEAGTVVRIDAGGSEDEVFERVRKEVNARWPGS